MSDLFENHIVGFPTRWLIFCLFSEKIEMVKSKWGLALSAVVTVVGSLCISVSLCSQLGLNSRLNGR